MQNQSLKEKIRSQFVNAPHTNRVDLMGKTIIVTGCSLDSLGYATAKTLAEWGAAVIITTRIQPEIVVAALKAELLEAVFVDATIDGHELDLTNADSVKGFVQWFNNFYGDRLDVLVNNAGIHLDLLSQWKEPALSEDGFEIQWRTNYLGTMHLTHLLLPLLQKTAKTSGDARIVNVVSQLHNKGFNAGLLADYPYNSWVAYGMSKLALVHATFELQRRLASDKVQAYCLHPGAVYTNVADKGLAGNEVLQSIRNLLAPVEQFFMKTKEEGAQTSIFCATQPQLQGGQYFQNCRVREASSETSDVGVAEKLWAKTDIWLKTH